MSRSPIPKAIGHIASSLGIDPVRRRCLAHQGDCYASRLPTSSRKVQDIVGDGQPGSRCSSSVSLFREPAPITLLLGHGTEAPQGPVAVLEASTLGLGFQHRVNAPVW